ncbi:hypothetical protein Taro_028356 [Colocasia esculenta]|uniref:Uncharacterized protein n=1 Tax=Colocasia esculenta TaxID=4460 RepID=A0A843VB07_COLES|nr:hypothetical protein [Colocasia esculenta]
MMPWGFSWRFSQDQFLLPLQFCLLQCSLLWSVSFELCILVKVLSLDRPLSLLVEVLPRSALCSFWATVVLPLWFEVCRLVGLRSGEVLLGRLLAILVEVLPKAVSCYFGRLCVSPWLGWFVLFSCALRALPDGGLSWCPVFCALLKPWAFRVFRLWVSGGESPSVGPVSSRAIGADAGAAP